MKVLVLFSFFLFWARPVLSQPTVGHIIKMAELNELLLGNSDTSYILNFWATWCKPCMEELPFFIKAEQQLKELPVKFIFISLDFKSSYELRFLPMVKEKGLKYAYLLNEPDYNSWINKVDSSWQGSIPATLMTVKNKKYFAEKQFTYEELMEWITKNLN